MKMNMSTKASTELQILQKVIEKWNDKIEKSHPQFWKSLANSYYNLESSAIDDQKFLSTISFYPDLMEQLIDSLSNTKLEIIFFSTLLPRHFWNFPIIKHLREKRTNNNSSSHNYYFSRCPKFLETYRERIENLIQGNGIKLTRVTFIADKEMYFRNTRLFSLNDFRKDDKYSIDNKQQIHWADLYNKSTFNRINEYSSGVDKKTLKLFFDTDISSNVNGLKNEELNNILTKLVNSNEYFYNFSQIEDKNTDQTVLKYYLNKLHSQESSRLFIIGKNNKNSVKLFGNQYQKHFVKNLSLSDEFSPNLGIIKITQNTDVKTIILNTYMDIVKNIVKMEVITQGDDKYELLNSDITYILQETKNQTPLFSKLQTEEKSTVDYESGN